MTLKLEELQERLAQLLSGQTSLDQFDAWFAVASWNMHRGAPEARELAADIELAIAEFDDGLLSEQEFWADLRKFALASKTQSAVLASK